MWTKLLLFAVVVVLLYSALGMYLSQAQAIQNAQALADDYVPVLGNVSQAFGQ